VLPIRRNRLDLLYTDRGDIENLLNEEDLKDYRRSCEFEQIDIVEELEIFIG